jgi:hypothetical protein
VAAAEGGRDLGDGALIRQPLGFNTEPANLVNFGDDANFFFTWQGKLWRTNLRERTAEGGTQAHEVSPPEALVPYQLPAVSSGSNRAVFIAGNRGAQYATVRENVLASGCEEGEAGEILPTATVEATAGAGTAEASPGAATAEATPAAATAGPTSAEATSEATPLPATGGAATAEPSPQPTS